MFRPESIIFGLASISSSNRLRFRLGLHWYKGTSLLYRQELVEAVAYDVRELVLTQCANTMRVVRFTQGNSEVFLTLRGK